MRQTAYLKGFGASIPDNHYSNEDLCELLGFPPSKAARYRDLLGVKSRPLCIDHRDGGRQIVTGEELAYRASQAALEDAELEARQIDTVISCSSFFDYVAPPVSSRLLKRFDLAEAQTFDLMGGCAEFLHGLHLAWNMIRLEQAEHVLVTSSEVINAWWRQTRYTLEHFIFGDTGGAFIVSAEEGPYAILDCTLNTRSRIEGEPAELICVPILGGKEPAPLFYENNALDPAVAGISSIPAELRLVHNGKQVSLGAPRVMVEATTNILEANSVRPTDSYLVPHQASIHVLGALQDTGIPVRQIAISLPERGNMSTSSIPVALTEHRLEAGRHRYLTLTSVGVGMSYGAMLLERTNSCR